MQKGEAVSGYNPCDVLGDARKGISLIYATDTRPLDIIASNGKGADLMILEGMYGDDELLPKAEQASHMTMCEAAELAKKADTSELWLTHYSPVVVNPLEYEEKVKSIFSGTVFGFDGLSCKLKFE